MKYKINDKEIKAHMFISFIKKIWKGNYSIKKRKRHYLKPLI